MTGFLRAPSGMPAPTKATIVRASALLLAIGVNALLLALLASSRARFTQQPLAAAMMWIVLERSREPQPRPARDRTRRAPPGRKEPTPTDGLATETIIQAVPAPQSAPQAPVTPPLVDWNLEGERAAERFAANYGKPDTFSPPPVTDLPAKLCAPRVPDQAMQEKMDELVPLPPDPVMPPAWPPPGSVVLAGNVVVQIMQFSTPVGRSVARGAQPARDERRRGSSVPDPNTCD